MHGNRRLNASYIRVYHWIDLPTGASSLVLYEYITSHLIDRIASHRIRTTPDLSLVTPLPILRSPQLVHLGNALLELLVLAFLILVSLVL